MEKITDKKAKFILDDKWPEFTDRIVSHLRGHHCIRARPSNSKSPLPQIISGGSWMNKIQPDGLYIYFWPDSFADIFCIEVCGSVQNLHEKRSRYMPTHSRIAIKIYRKWLEEKIKYRTKMKARWEVTGLSFWEDGFDPKDLPDSWEFDIRMLRVLYFLPDEIYQKWYFEHDPIGYEYFSPHSKLAKFSSKEFTILFQSMSRHSHFSTVIG